MNKPSFTMICNKPEPMVSLKDYEALVKYNNLVEEALRACASQLETLLPMNPELSPSYRVIVNYSFDLLADKE